MALRGRVWPGGDAAVLPDGVVVVAGDGHIAALGPRDQVPLPADLPVLGEADAWVGPGVLDAHVHLAFGTPEAMLAGGVVGVRDLGAPAADARGWRTGQRPPPGWPQIAVAGPLLTAPGGYPSTSWGARGFTRFLSGPRQARAAVAALAEVGVDIVKIALEPAGGLPVPDPATVRAVVEAAHQRALPVTAHALTVVMVERAMDAGVDELCHVPVERLPPPLIERIAATGAPVVSTLHPLAFGTDATRPDPTPADSRPLTNARDLVSAGVRLVYGTDLGNAGTRTGVEPRELQLLADCGLGERGALRAATDGAAVLAGFRGRQSGRLVTGERAALVVLRADPLQKPETWRTALAVVAGDHLVTDR